MRACVRVYVRVCVLARAVAYVSIRLHVAVCTRQCVRVCASVLNRMCKVRTLMCGFFACVCARALLAFRAPTLSVVIFHKKNLLQSVKNPSLLTCCKV